MKSLTKVILTNFLIFSFFIFILEIFFGFWFSEHSFGPYMREHRLKNNHYILTYANETYDYIYRRNYYGFRGEEIDPSKIDAVILGGSTVDERYKPEEKTITEQLNFLIKNKGYNFKIVNAGIEGQSTFGYIFNFKHWFPKLKNFSPKLYIFYVGINDNGWITSPDRKLDDNLGGDGHVKNPEKLEVFFDTLKNNSFIYDKLRIIKHKYHKTKKVMKYDLNYYQNEDLTNYEYINYNRALNLHNIDNLNAKYKKSISNYLDRIDLLIDFVEKKKGVPIFINQVHYVGLADEGLFILNHSLIRHCNKKKIYCIDLAKKFEGQLGYWFDQSHTTPLGSKMIAKTVVDELLDIVEKENLF